MKHRRLPQRLAVSSHQCSHFLCRHWSSMERLDRGHGCCLLAIRLIERFSFNVFTRFLDKTNWYWRNMKKLNQPDNNGYSNKNTQSLECNFENIWLNQYSWQLTALWILSLVQVRSRWVEAVVAMIEAVPDSFSQISVSFVILVWVENFVIQKKIVGNRLNRQL